MQIARVTCGVMMAWCLCAPAGMTQTMDHSAHQGGHHGAHQGAETPLGREVGQSAFAAIQETVARLQADPETDWTQVNIDALRDHLVDMDQVTLRARVETQVIPEGARLIVRSEVPEVTDAIQRMVPAHAAVMSGSGDWSFVAEPLEDGAILTVTGPQDDTARIRGLGFFGVLSLGMHHPTHHLAMARGMDPHDH